MDKKALAKFDKMITPTIYQRRCLMCDLDKSIVQRELRASYEGK